MQVLPDAARAACCCKCCSSSCYICKWCLLMQVLPAAAGAASAAAVSVADASVPSYKTLPLLYEMAWHCKLTPIDIIGAHVRQIMI